MNKNKLSALLLALFLTACASSSDKVTRLNASSDVKVIDLRSIEMNNLLNVQATLHNTSWSEDDIMYRFKWTDANGMALGDETWKPLKLYGDQKITVRGVAPSVNATHFNVEITD